MSLFTVRYRNLLEQFVPSLRTIPVRFLLMSRTRTPSELTFTVPAVVPASSVT